MTKRSYSGYGTRSNYIAYAILVFWVFVALGEAFILPVGHSLEGLMTYDEQYIDKYATNYQAPTWWNEENGHILGTDKLGRDVAAGIVHGASTSLLLSFWTILFSTILGGFLGVLAGYYGDTQYKLSSVEIGIYILALCHSFYTIYWGRALLDYAIGGGIFLALIRVGILVHRYSKHKRHAIPLDTLVQGMIQVQDSIPALIIVIVCVGIFSSHGMWNLVAILTFFYTFLFTKYIRNEARIIRTMSYVTAEKTLGFSDTYIMCRTILPLAMRRIMPILLYAVASIILLEAALSFLGLGMAVDHVTWGKMIAGARSAPRAWWLAIFPGLAIFSIVYSLHVLSDSQSNSTHNR